MPPEIEKRGRPRFCPKKTAAIFAEIEFLRNPVAVMLSAIWRICFFEWVLELRALGVSASTAIHSRHQPPLLTSRSSARVALTNERTETGGAAARLGRNMLRPTVTLIRPYLGDLAQAAMPRMTTLGEPTAWLGW